MRYISENETRREMLKEENAQLMIFVARHLSWAESSQGTAMGDQNHMLAEMLKDIVDDNQTLIAWLKAL